MHIEFYVLWKNNTWTLEGVDVDVDTDTDGPSLQDDIDVGKRTLRLHKCIDPRGLVTIGPVYCALDQRGQS